jgi:acetyltransferase-like isoleucine patch superfamily enzyme
MDLFISKRAAVRGHLEGDARIFGPSLIGEGTIIGDGVTLGYPVRKKILSLKDVTAEDYDALSEGCKIGKGCIIRSSTIIYEGADLGDNIETGHGVLIREKTVIGERTRIGTYTVIDGNVVIGSNNNIQTGVYIPPGTQIGSDVFMGPYVTVTNDRYPPSPKVSGVVIEDGAAVGSRAVLIAGVRVGKRAVVGAGAVVTKDVPPEAVVVGVPARVIMSRADYDKKQHDYLSSP